MVFEMKTKAKILTHLLLLLLCLVALKANAQTDFDMYNPIWEDVPDKETSIWTNKSIEDWKVSFGDDVEEWNPVQMEFYKQVRSLALYDNEKREWIEKSTEDWIEDLGQMDKWKIEDMLFYAAIQDLKSTYTIIDLDQSNTENHTKIVQQDFDIINPIWEDVSQSETEVWTSKDNDSWKAIFGQDVEEWNPVQMEFYKQVKILALFEDEKLTWTALGTEGWVKEIGVMENWTVLDMLFYAAIQDLKAGYYSGIEISPVIASNFDLYNPIWEDLNRHERRRWMKRKINSWKESFGQEVEEWNPIQMEFYKQVKTLGLKKNENEKKKWLDKSIEDWIVEFGEMDKWKVEDMLFYAAIQDLKNAN